MRKPLIRMSLDAGNGSHIISFSALLSFQILPYCSTLINDWLTDWAPMLLLGNVLQFGILASSVKHSRTAKTEMTSLLALLFIQELWTVDAAFALLTVTIKPAFLHPLNPFLNSCIHSWYTFLSSAADVWFSICYHGFHSLGYESQGSNFFWLNL